MSTEDDLAEASKQAEAPIRVLIAVLGERQRNQTQQFVAMREDQIRWQSKHDGHHEKLEKDLDAAFRKITDESKERERLAGRVRMIWFVPTVVGACAASLAFAVWLIGLLAKGIQ